MDVKEPRHPVIVSAHRSGSEWLKLLIEQSLDVYLPRWSWRTKHFWPMYLLDPKTELFVLHKHPLAWLLSIETFFNRWCRKVRYRWHRITGSRAWSISERWSTDLLYYLHAYRSWTDLLDDEPGVPGRTYRYRDVLEHPRGFVEHVAEVLGEPVDEVHQVDRDARTGSQAGGTFDRRDYYLDEEWRLEYAVHEVEDLIRWIDEANGWHTLNRLGYTRDSFRGTPS